MTMRNGRFYKALTLLNSVGNCEMSKLFKVGKKYTLMNRASPFIGALQCGKKEKDFFVIQTLKEVILRTGDVTLVTDGE